MTGGVILAVTIWWLVSARNTFTGPRHTISEIDAELGERPASRRRGPASGDVGVRHPRGPRARHRAGPRNGPARRRRRGRRRRRPRQGGLPGLARGRARPTVPRCCAGWPTRSSTTSRRSRSLEARNAGKPIGDARGEIGMVVDVFRYYAGAPERLLGDTIPIAGGMAFTVREPLGVVGLIIPWNFPLVIAAWKLGPALAAGNTVVLKPAELTPLTALRLEKLALEAGLPEGVLNVVAGPGLGVRAAARRAPRRRQDRVHRLDRGRPLDRRRRRADDQARHARARRQVRQHRLRRRRPRAGRRDGAAGRVRQRRARTAARGRGSSSSTARSTASWTRWRARSRR